MAAVRGWDFLWLLPPTLLWAIVLLPARGRR